MGGPTPIVEARVEGSSAMGGPTPIVEAIDYETSFVFSSE